MRIEYAAENWNSPRSGAELVARVKGLWQGWNGTPLHVAIGEGGQFDLVTWKATNWFDETLVVSPQAAAVPWGEVADSVAQAMMTRPPNFSESIEWDGRNSGYRPRSWTAPANSTEELVSRVAGLWEGWRGPPVSVGMCEGNLMEQVMWTSVAETLEEHILDPTCGLLIAQKALDAPWNWVDSAVRRSLKDMKARGPKTTT